MKNTRPDASQIIVDDDHLDYTREFLENGTMMYKCHFKLIEKRFVTDRILINIICLETDFLNHYDNQSQIKSVTIILPFLEAIKMYHLKKHIQSHL